MIIKALLPCKDHISHYRITKFRQLLTAYQLEAEVHMLDKSTLFIFDYTFSDGSHSYIYHWQDEAGRLRCRWDNAPHYPHISTHPYHKETPGSLEECLPMNLNKVAEEIREGMSRFNP